MAGPALDANTRVFAKTDDGTPSPTFAATDAFLIYGNTAQVEQHTVDLQQLQAITGENTPVRATPGIERVSGTWQVALMGTGGPAAAPYYEPLLKSCGLQAVTPAAGAGGDAGFTIYEYKPFAGPYEPLMAQINREGVQIVARNMFGNLSFSGEAGNAVLANYQWAGKFGSRANVPMPTATFPTDRKSGLIATGLDLLGNTAVVARAFTLNTGFPTVDRTNFAGTDTAGRGFLGTYPAGIRNPTATVLIEAETTILPADWHEIMRQGTIANNISFEWLSDDHAPDPSAAGDKLGFTIRNPQISAVPPQSAGGLLLYNLTFRLQNATPNNDWSLYVKSATA